MQYKNILIIKLSAIGDVIHALPVAKALKEANPECRITWIVEKPAHDLLANNPYIDEIIVFEKQKFKPFTGLLSNGYKLAKQLRQAEFDLAIDLQGLAKSAAISFLSGAKEKLVYCNAREMSHMVGKVVCGRHANGHVVDRYVDVVRFISGRKHSVDFRIEITEEEEKKAIAESIADNFYKCAFSGEDLIR